MSLGGGGGCEIPKGERAGRARSLGIWPGGARSRGGEIPWTPDRGAMFTNSTYKVNITLNNTVRIQYVKNIVFKSLQ